MKLKTQDHYHGIESLTCPLCGEDYTHVIGVEVFSRIEDSKFGVHVSVKNCCSTASVSVDTDISQNTSERRGSVHLLIGCEHCGDVSRVAFSQHKGITLVNVRVDDGNH